MNQNVVAPFVQVGKCFTLNPPSATKIKAICDALALPDKPGHFVDSLKHQSQYTQLTGPDICCLIESPWS